MEESMKTDSLPQLKWNLRNSIPYLIASSVPTVLLIYGLIGQIVWAVIWTALIVGIGLTDLKMIDLSSGEMEFDENDSNDEGQNDV
jgi:hypothetical protein